MKELGRALLKEQQTERQKDVGTKGGGRPQLVSAHECVDIHIPVPGAHLRKAWALLEDLPLKWVTILLASCGKA